MIRGIVNQRTVKTKTFPNNNVIETIWSRFEHTSFRTADISLHTIRKRTAPASAWVRPVPVSAPQPVLPRSRDSARAPPQASFQLELCGFSSAVDNSSEVIRASHDTPEVSSASHGKQPCTSSNDADSGLVTCF